MRIETPTKCHERSQRPNERLWNVTALYVNLYLSWFFFFNALSLKIKHTNYSPFVKKQPTNWTAVQHSDILLFDPNAKHKISNLFAWYFTILLGTWYGKKDEIYTHPDWTDQMINSKAGDLLYRTVFHTFIGFRVCFRHQCWS